MPILPLLGLGAACMPIADMVLAGRYQDAINVGVTNFTGYNVWTKKFEAQYLINTYTPILAGVVGHMIANKLGVNKAIRKVPMVGKWIAL